MRLLFVGALVASWACNAGGGGGTAAPGSAAAPAAKHGSAGFSASLTAELAADNTGSSATPAAAGSASAPSPAGSATQAAATPSSAGTPSSPNAPLTDNAPATNGPQIDKTGPVTNHDISKSDTNAAGPPRPNDQYVHVAPPADLAAIKLDMEPNWDRDFTTAGTISFVLRVPGSADTRVFSFNYGYDYPGAPSDRDAYKKFLADKNVLTVTLDRQRGAAWYLEGTDAAGQPAFRYIVLYGGKRLVCYGSLYKTREATALGPDLRDKVVQTAKKICETIAL
ncbi:MAG TPA: hypothetical protein VGL61_09920 [Kofleriaceae bacterium]|jgi:hypothetical protein